MTDELRLRLQAIQGWVDHALADECEPALALDAVRHLADAAESFVASCG